MNFHARYPARLASAMVPHGIPAWDTVPVLGSTTGGEVTTLGGGADFASAGAYLVQSVSP